MKKFYKSLSILALVALSNGVMAQATTITSSAMPQIGFVYNMMSDTASTVTGFTVSPGSGSAQTWNYTIGWDSLYADPTSFVSKSSGTGSASFTNANMASNIGGNWVYWVSGASGLKVDGYYATISGSPTAINFSPDPTQIPVPFTYTSTPVVSDYTAMFTITSGTITATVHHRAHRVTTADAFGSLTTPTATYPNTLRVKTYEITSDSIYVFSTIFYTAQYDTTTNYTWLQNSQDAELMSIDFNHAGVVTKASYLQSFSNSVATISQPSAAFNVYPNPASDMTCFTYENKATGLVNIQLLDITGKQVAVLLNEQQAVGRQKVNINLQALHLPKGMYFLQLNSNNTLQTIKLSID